MRGEDTFGKDYFRLSLRRYAGIILVVAEKMKIVLIVVEEELKNLLNKERRNAWS